MNDLIARLQWVENYLRDTVSETADHLERLEAERSAAYRAGLEAAAAICDDLETKSNRPSRCADAIRDLAEQTAAKP